MRVLVNIVTSVGERDRCRVAYLRPLGIELLELMHEPCITSGRLCIASLPFFLEFPGKVSLHHHSGFSSIWLHLGKFQCTGRHKKRTQKSCQAKTRLSAFAIDGHGRRPSERAISPQMSGRRGFDTMRMASTL